MLTIWTLNCDKLRIIGSCVIYETIHFDHLVDFFITDLEYFLLYNIQIKGVLTGKPKTLFFYNFA